MRTRFVLGGLAALMSAAVPAMGLTPAEEALAARIPADVRPHCVPATTPTAGAEAALFCDLPTTQGLVARYERFPTYSAAEARYRQLASIAGRSPRTDISRCASGTLSAEGVFARGGIPAGRVACYRPTRAAYMITLDAGTAIVWVALRPDRNRRTLYTWWTAHAELGAAVPEVATTGALFPNGLERALLLDVGAAVATSGCVRPRQTGAWLAALRCPLGSGGQVTFRRYADNEAAQADYRRSITALGITEHTGGACDDRRDTERYYGQGPRGRYACTTVGARARLEWLDFSRRIRGIAATPGRQADLLAWWRTQPR